MLPRYNITVADLGLDLGYHIHLSLASIDHLIHRIRFFLDRLYMDGNSGLLGKECTLKRNGYVQLHMPGTFLHLSSAITLA